MGLVLMREWMPEAGGRAQGSVWTNAADLGNIARMSGMQAMKARAKKAQRRKQ
jgi:hypothetical protein